MAYFEVTFNSDDPTIASSLREVDAMPRTEERLRIEAGLAQWFANKCLEDAGRMAGREAAYAHNRRRNQRENGGQ